MWGRGRRCGGCGSRLVGLPPAVPPVRAVLIDTRRRKGHASWSADLCLACEARNDRALAVFEAGRQAAVAESARHAGEWLRGAPVLETPPGPVGTYAERWPHVPFVEVMGFHTASQHLARVRHGMVPGPSLDGVLGGPMPRDYANVLSGSAPYPDEHRLYVYGSVYRLADGDIALHWHSSHLYPSID